MSRSLIRQACVAAALFAVAPASALAAANTAGTAATTTDPMMNGTTDPAMNVLATDPALNTTTDPVVMNDPADMLGDDNAGEREEDDGFPWDLLGLLGLAGLLGLKKRDRDDDHLATGRGTGTTNR